MIYAGEDQLFIALRIIIQMIILVIMRNRSIYLRRGASMNLLKEGYETVIKKRLLGLKKKAEE